MSARPERAGTAARRVSNSPSGGGEKLSGDCGQGETSWALSLTLSRPASLAPVLAALSCVLFCLNGELLQALQLHTPAPEHGPSLGLNLVLCHLGGLAFAPHFLLADGFGPPSAAIGLVGNAACGLSGWLAERPRLAAMLFAWMLMGYNIAWLASARFLAAAVTNALFQTSAAMVYAISVPFFGERLCASRLLGVAMMLVGSMLSSGVGYVSVSDSGHAAGTGIGVALALLAALGVSIYQVLFRQTFGHLKHEPRFLAFFSCWVSVWHLLTVLPALYVASTLGIAKLEWPEGRHAVIGTAVSACIASSVNALYLCVALWGSVMLLPCVSALSVPLTVALDAAIHNVLPSKFEVLGHALIVMAVILVMDLLQHVMPAHGKSFGSAAKYALADV